jgi:hypothetical protein
MKLSLEPWMPEYDTSLQEQPGLLSSRPNDVNLFVEGLEAWNPVQPLATRAAEVDFERLYFIDGRRRIEAKVYGETLVNDEPQASPGLLGTFAVGLVESRMTNSPATILETLISRVLVLNHPEGENLIIKTRGHEYGDLEYKFVQINDTVNTDTALTTRLQFLMRNAEDELSSSLSLDDALLILDGPLQRRAPDRALGYVKTIHNFYVPPLEQRTIRQLQRGQRTPIFSIKVDSSVTVGTCASTTRPIITSLLLALSGSRSETNLVWLGHKKLRTGRASCCPNMLPKVSATLERPNN